MAQRRYKTLRVWHNSLLMVWALPFFLLPGVIVVANSGQFGLLIGLGLVGIIGLVVANVRDRHKVCNYLIEGDHVTLSRNGQDRILHMAEIADASLIDRSGAREYLREWSGRNRDDIPPAEWIQGFGRYCTVDIGLTSFTMGIGRSLIDRVPNGKTDLVLLRLLSGEAFLLSPVHSQDFVEKVGRKKMYPTN